MHTCGDNSKNFIIFLMRTNTTGSFRKVHDIFSFLSLYYNVSSNQGESVIEAF